MDITQICELCLSFHMCKEDRTLMVSFSVHQRILWMSCLVTAYSEFWLEMMCASYLPGAKAMPFTPGGFWVYSKSQMQASFGEFF
jgi:hypothetical protein